MQMKQALAKLHQKVTPKLKPIELAYLIKEGLSYQPPFKDAIQFVNAFYNILPPTWMGTFADPKLLKALVAEVKIQYLSIILKYSQVDPYQLKAIVEKRFTREFLSFQKEITNYQMANPNNILALSQDNTIKVDYLFNYAIRWMNLSIDVNIIIIWLLLVQPTQKSHHDLIILLVNEIITLHKLIKWDQLYKLCTLKLNGGGNISSLFARIPISSSEITSKLYPHMINCNFPISRFIKIMMNFSCPTKVVEITQCIIKRLAQDKKFREIQDIFNNFCKPVLLKHMVNSIYYMEFDKIMRCLMAIPEVKFTFSNQQVSQIMSKLNVYKPQQHLKLMEDIISKYSPESKIKLQNVKQELLHQTKINQNMENTTLKLKKKQSFESSQQLIMECQNLIGLPNIGNSCYMNSFLISLYFCDEFLKTILKNQYKDKSMAYLRQIYLCLVKKESQNLSKLLFGLKQSLPPQFKDNNDQQDAMDFGREILSKILSSDASMSHLFQSKWTEVFRCLDQHVHSKLSSVQNTLILNFPNPQVFASMIKADQVPKGVMLEQILQFSFKNVILDNNYTCSVCNKPFKKIVKQMYISKLPKILILCFSRFAYSYKSKKILDKVTAKQSLSIIDETGKKKYRLVSFLNHMGSTSNSGHYQAYVFNQQHGWINFDDDYVTQITVKNAFQLFSNFNAFDTPYILFYEKIDDK